MTMCIRMGKNEKIRVRDVASICKNRVLVCIIGYKPTTDVYPIKKSQQL